MCGASTYSFFRQNCVLKCGQERVSLDIPSNILLLGTWGIGVCACLLANGEVLAKTGMAMQAQKQYFASIASIPTCQQIGECNPGHTIPVWVCRQACIDQ